VVIAAVSTVHTSGINWESVSVIIGSVVAALVFLVSLQERRAATIRNDIGEAVNHLAEVLTAKLETKDVVNSLKVDVAALKARFDREGRHG
jgi:N-glycosylase/DNA lyase